MSTVLNIILSSIVLTAFINLWGQNKKREFKYFSDENDKRQRDIFKLMKKIENAKSKKELRKLIIELSGVLDFYGKEYNKYEDDLKVDIFKGEHIWKLISEMENTDDWSQKTKLIDYLGLLRQYEKEKNSKKLVSKYGDLIFNVLFWVGTILAVCELYYLNKQVKNPNNNVFTVIILYIMLQFAAYLITIIKTVLNKMKCMRIKGWYEYSHADIVRIIFAMVIIAISDIFCSEWILYMYDYVSAMWYINLCLKMLSIIGLFWVDVDSNSIYETYCRKVSERMGYEEIKIFAKRYGKLVNQIFVLLEKWNINALFYSTKEEKNFSKIPVDMQKARIVVEYKGKYKKIYRKKDIEIFIEKDVAKTDI